MNWMGIHFWLSIEKTSNKNKKRNEKEDVN